MMLVSPLFRSVIETKEGCVSTLVIENQGCFRRFLTDLVRQIDGADGDAVLSRNNKPVSIQKNMEILTEFAPFAFNGKSVQNRLISELNARAMGETQWHTTGELVNSVERYIDELALELDLPCGVECMKLSFDGILKSAGITVATDSQSPIAEVLDYMELSRMLFGNRLFVAVNMRSWFPDVEMELFAKDAAAKKLDLLLLENCDHPHLSNERRWTIDSDLCEF